MQSAPFRRDGFFGKNFNYCPKTYKVHGWLRVILTQFHMCLKNLVADLQIFIFRGIQMKNSRTRHFCERSDPSWFQLFLPSQFHPYPAFNLNDLEFISNSLYQLMGIPGGRRESTPLTFSFFYQWSVDWALTEYRERKSGATTSKKWEVVLSTATFSLILWYFELEAWSIISTKWTRYRESECYEPVDVFYIFNSGGTKVFLFYLI